MILLLFFALTHKAIEVDGNNTSGTNRKILNRFAKADENGQYSVSAFLIAQFGKNDKFRGDSTIKGDELMDVALDILYDVQHDIGGKVVFLECEEIEFLLNFYQNDHNRYKPFGKRHSADDKKEYIQLLRFI